MKDLLVKAVWTLSNKIRDIVRPLVVGTPIQHYLKVPYQAIRRKFDYRAASKSSIFCWEEEMEFCSLRPENTLDLMISRYKPKTVLDIGCGTGVSINYLLARGVDAIGIEGSSLAISKAEHPERITQADLNLPMALDRKFDAVFCYEVVEHIHPDYLDSFLTTLCSHSDLIIMSHAQPGQGGEGHFNEQPDSYWVEQLSQRKFSLDEEATIEFKGTGDAYAKNLLVFRRA